MWVFCASFKGVCRRSHSSACSLFICFSSFSARSGSTGSWRLRWWFSMFRWWPIRWCSAYDTPLSFAVADLTNEFLLFFMCIAQILHLLKLSRLRLCEGVSLIHLTRFSDAIIRHRSCCSMNPGHRLLLNDVRQVIVDWRYIRLCMDRSLSSWIWRLRANLAFLCLSHIHTHFGICCLSLSQDGFLYDFGCHFVQRFLQMQCKAWTRIARVLYG